MVCGLVELCNKNITSGGRRKYAENVPKLEDGARARQKKMKKPKKTGQYFKEDVQKALITTTLKQAKISRMSRTPNPAKALVREEIDKRLATLTPEEIERQSKLVYNKIINHPYYKSAQRVAIFMSTPQEVDTAPIIKHIKERGGSAFVPQYAGGVMRMLKLESGDEDAMPLTRHGIQQHSKDMPRENALERGLDLIIAPGAAFTRAGGRVGHGGGYYDKYIAQLRANPDTAPKILAVAFKCQVLDEVPMDELDQQIDEVIFAED